jgi:hypothetical protein
MGLLDQTNKGNYDLSKFSQKDYYKNRNDLGGYQFTSLNDIINQFLVVYVGEGKLISKVSRTDVAFHAQRALAELSFDTFKSIKSQEILLPPSNTMMLPHDYVNYTKVSWSDSAGVKRILYPTSKTSNPFKIKQNDDDSYDFMAREPIGFNGDFSESLDNSAWQKSLNYGGSQGSNLGVPENDTFQGIRNGRYEWTHICRSLSGGLTTRHFALWQTIDVSEIDYLTLSAKGLSSAAKTGKTAGIVRIGFSTQIDLTAQMPVATVNPSSQGNTPPPLGANWDGYNPDHTNPNSPPVPEGGKPSKNMDTDIFDVENLNGGQRYIEFNAGDDTMSAATFLEDIDVRNLTTVDLLVVSSGGTVTSGATLHSSSVGVPNATFGINAIDDITLTYEMPTENIQSDGDSSTWSKYKGHTLNENVNPETYSYDTDTYNFNTGERYGLDPEHSQINGSFYIDNLRGLINFSSNLSGKTVILDYISDSLGTDEEMKVHKFAEEAMYKWLTHAILATKANVPEYQVARYKKERFAAIRQAKLRLSNIKLEELTQVLRGKSKHIKH